MITITLKPTDGINTVLPFIEAAMESGDTCQLGNLHYLGPFELVALVTLATATHFRDSDTGMVCRAHPGFRLMGVDNHGVTRRLVN